MAINRSISDCLAGLGLSTIFIGILMIIFPNAWAFQFIIIGIVLFFSGVGIKYGVDYLNEGKNPRKLKVEKRCPVCTRPIVEKNLEYCPECGSKI